MPKYRNSDAKFSLFTAFTILVCVLGIFIFILISSVTISLGVGKSLILFPSSSNEAKKPIYFEWTKNKLISHPNHDTLKFEKNLNKLRTWKEVYSEIKDEIENNTSFNKLFSKIQQNRDSTFVFIFVRQSGCGDFNCLLGYIQKEIKVDVGYELYEEKIKIKISKK